MSAAPTDLASNVNQPMPTTTTMNDVSSTDTESVSSDSSKGSPTPAGRKDFVYDGAADETRPGGIGPNDSKPSANEMPMASNPGNEEDASKTRVLTAAAIPRLDETKPNSTVDDTAKREEAESGRAETTALGLSQSAPTTTKRSTDSSQERGDEQNHEATMMSQETKLGKPEHSIEQISSNRSTLHEPANSELRDTLQPGSHQNNNGDKTEETRSAAAPRSQALSPAGKREKTTIQGTPYLLSTHTNPQDIGEYYYLGVGHLWLCDVESVPPAKCVVCRHCLWSAKHATWELLAKGFCHAVLHLLNKCTEVPPDVRSKLTEYRNNPNGMQGSLQKFCSNSWIQPTAVIHRASRKRPRSIKRSPKRTNTTQDGEKNSSKRSRRKSTPSLPRRFVPEEPGTLIRPSVELPSVGEAGTWSFIEDGKYPIRQLYETVTSFGREHVKAVFQEKEKKHRLHRIMKIMKEIGRLTDLGFPVDDVLDALCVFQAGRSLYSFSDDLKDLTASDIEKLSKTGKSARSLERVEPPPDVLLDPKVFVERDPCTDFFCEETAFLFHDNKSTNDCKKLRLAEQPLDELEPLPPPKASPKFPNDGRVRYKYEDEVTKRILYADFTGVSREDISTDDLRTYASALSNDHITVISLGLINQNALNSKLWDLRTIQKESGSRVHHKFKRYTKTNPAVYSEMDDLLEGPMGTFVDYLGAHVNHLENDTTEESSFGFRTEKGEPIQVNSKEVIYMLDLDLPRILPRHFSEFSRNFKLHEIMPGGDWCMMNAIPQSARPFMGPNCYVTPGGAYTHMHQDGHGTVDSGHCCLEGYNEVVMLRRLPERHKLHATTLLPNQGEYDALYTFPHGIGKKPDWPTNDTIKAWQKMGYAPSVFILEPGQHVHINKGRLHAFRKTTAEELPPEDCHFELRRALLSRRKTKSVPLCVSVAWDWQFTGICSESINREMTSTLECQILLYHKPSTKCLAVPRASLLGLGYYCQSAITYDHIPMIRSSAGGELEDRVISRDQLVKGIAPSLQFVLDENIAFLEHAKSLPESNGMGRLRMAAQKDTALNPLHATVDPDGNDYFCGICARELENVYLHCDGCEDLLGKDFNICMACYNAEKWKATIHVTGRDVAGHRVTSAFCHTGKVAWAGKRCGACSKRFVCPDCDKCPRCECVCHGWYTVRRRFYDLEELQRLSDWIKTRAGDESVEHSKLTAPRLLIACDRPGRGLKAKRAILKEYPINQKLAPADNTEESNHEGIPLGAPSPPVVCAVCTESVVAVEPQGKPEQANKTLQEVPPRAPGSGSVNTSSDATGNSESKSGGTSGSDDLKTRNDKIESKKFHESGTGGSGGTKMISPVEAGRSIQVGPGIRKFTKLASMARPKKVKRNILRVNSGKGENEEPCGSRNLTRTALTRARSVASSTGIDVMGIMKPHPSMDGMLGMISPVALKLRSVWWLAYHVRDDRTEIYCNCCGATLVYDHRNAANDLKSHLKSQHPEEYAVIGEVNSGKLDLLSFISAQHNGASSVA